MAGTKTKPKPDIEEFVPSIEEVEQMRQEREINSTALSHAVGYNSPGAWSAAINKGGMSLEIRLIALPVFNFHDQNNYLPMVVVH